MNSAHSELRGGAAAVVDSSRTLREVLDARAARGERLPLDVAVALLVPLCSELADIHAQGYGFFLHPSSVEETPEGRLTLARAVAEQLPSNPRDQACLPPETRPGFLNDACGNVYAMGAILYEVVTGESVARGMKRPREIVPTLPAALDATLSTALITDPAHRPSDLHQLAHSIHQLARPGTVPPPTSRPSNAAFSMPPIEVDVSLSLLPPEPNAPAAPAHVPHIIDPRHPVPPPSTNGYGVAIRAAEAPASGRNPAADPTADLRAQLEADARPRYFVRQGGMDHGPFTAVELVRHIDQHAFSEEETLVDSLEGQEAPIREWPTFAPFAEHARRQRALDQRQKDIVEVAARERKSSRGKTVAGLLLVLAILCGGGAWFVMTDSARSDRVAIQVDESTNVETDSALAIKSKKRSRRRSRRSRSGGGNVPVVSGGQSCEAAMDAYNETKVIGQQGQADITAGQYGRLLNSGSYFGHCGVPSSMAVSICAAVQNGRAVGVTVRTTPNDRKKASCITSSVRRLSFPSHPKLDVTRTSFAAQ